ncbi:HD domain-containing protein [Deinococcus cellulosilyticus]|uniref:Phosphohydrolase n=1 Tax=Deinococcus cellulosilyticus (strain DSM 18568 / NBRC 106333 / KACC 11606 / 5516J-15) TaxID=1223518 RepID=A0A511N4Q9_DEIC1|nr:phosphohydrolase [Deinococcus cellulosilyticus]GEM47849.1 hypothetical protein DC3_34840 [Deinococcus cellulosilyticus NBRC 106333 = KACC 11606]
MELFDRCLPHLNEPHRAYHNLTHIQEMLALMKEARITEHEIEFAIWGHDLVYDPKRNDNEEKSAELFTSWMRELEYPSNIIHQVERLILVTKHGDEPQYPIEAHMLDLDLSIFGQPRERFLEYNDQIRQEYSYVPKLVYAVKRKQVLLSFYSRKRIYITDYFFDRFEKQARDNLWYAITRLF